MQFVSIPSRLARIYNGSVPEETLGMLLTCQSNSNKAARIIYEEKRPTKRAPDGAIAPKHVAQFAKFGAIMFRSLANPPRR